MLKYCYWRRNGPEKDWGDPFTSSAHQKFLRAADFGKQYYAASYLPEFPGLGTVAANKFVAEMYLWLCGRPMPKLVGGQSWPAVESAAYGYPAELSEEYDPGLLHARIKGNPRDNVFWDASGSDPGVDERHQTGALRAEVVGLRQELVAVQDSLRAVLAKL